MHSLPVPRRTHSNPARLAVLAVMALLAPCASAQGTIELRRTARLQPEQSLTLSSIAELSGPDALRWADLDLSELTARPPSDLPHTPGDEPQVEWKNITIDQVRAELERQKDIHWGRLSLRGSLCSVQLAPKAAPSKPSATPPSAKDAAPATGPTIQELAQARIAQIIGLDAADVRTEFAQQDAELLAMHTSGRVVELQPMGKSDRITLSVRVFEEDRVVASGSIRAKVLVRRDVVVARDAVARGAGLTTENTAIESRWIGPTEIPAIPADALGKISKGRLKAGQMILPQDIEPAIAAKKGDMVSVDCISGTVILRRTMRALETGREGDTIELAGLTGKATAQARLSAPGRAVMVLAPIDHHARSASTSLAALDRDPELSTPSAAHPSAVPDLDAPPPAPPSAVQVGGIQVSRKLGSAQGRKTATFTRLADRKLDESDR